MQRRGHLDGPHLILGQAELLGDQSRHVGHALQVGAGAAVAVFDGAGQARQRFALALLHLVHAGQQALLQRQGALLDVLRLLAQLKQIAAAGTQLARTHRLDQEVDDARFQRGLTDGFVADHGDQDDGDVAVHRQSAEPAGELQPVHARHAVVEQQQVGAVLLAPFQGRQGIAEIVDGQLGRDVLDDMAQHGTRGRLIVDDDDVQCVPHPLWPRDVAVGQGYSGGGDARIQHGGSPVRRPGPRLGPRSTKGTDADHGAPSPDLYRRGRRRIDRPAWKSTQEACQPPPGCFRVPHVDVRRIFRHVRSRVHPGSAARGLGPRQCGPVASRRHVPILPRSVTLLTLAGTVGHPWASGRM